MRWQIRPRESDVVGIPIGGELQVGDDDPVIESEPVANGDGQDALVEVLSGRIDFKDWSLEHQVAALAILVSQTTDVGKAGESELVVRLTKKIAAEYRSRSGGPERADTHWIDYDFDSEYLRRYRARHGCDPSDAVSGSD